ncbi:hypothetical protein ABK040_011379 [Willaertia magna]
MPLLNFRFSSKSSVAQQFQSIIFNKKCTEGLHRKFNSNFKFLSTSTSSTIANKGLRYYYHTNSFNLIDNFEEEKNHLTTMIDPKKKGIAILKSPSIEDIKEHALKLAKEQHQCTDKCNHQHHNVSIDTNPTTEVKEEEELNSLRSPTFPAHTLHSTEQAEMYSYELYDKLLQNNKKFVEDKTSKDPEFFYRLKDVQRPDYLLIGCSDSRVPPDQLTGTKPGQLFIHRNVANLVVNTDLNFMSVLQYAVEVLKVKHVIVMGHTRCGGVRAALENAYHGLIDKWLRNIKDVYRLHQNELDSITNFDKKWERMIELNVIEQTLNICKTSIIQKAWARGEAIHIHGWVCDIETGLIKDLEIEETVWKSIENIYQIDFSENDLLK